MPLNFKRRTIRERVLQILYAYEMNPDYLQTHIRDMLSDLIDSNDKEFAKNLVTKVLEHQTELDEKIKSRVDNWDMNRIALIDRILLRMGICELLYFPDIPPKVSINESIEIAKRYSTSGSGKFINGILDAVLTEAKEKGMLNKTGRGLVEDSLSKLPEKN